jgi:hypothetical protein
MILAPTLTLNALRGPSVDPDAAAFAAASGATDVAALSAFVKGVKNLGLWESMVCWPLRSSQNAGTGTTAYSLGGLGTFNGTLVNGPTWGADGITFVNASSQHILMGSQVFTDSDYTMFAAFKLTDVAVTNLIACALSWNRGGFLGVASNGATTDRHAVWTNTGAFPGAQLSASGVSTVMHTAALSANASEFRFFTNGASFVSGAGNYQIATGSGKTVIGGANNIGAGIIGHFNGDIAFAFAASQHLSTANVAALNNLYKSTLGTGLSLP